MFDDFINRMMDVFATTVAWGFVFVIYLILGFIFGSKLARMRGHEKDDLTWLALGIGLFAFILFPFTFYAYYMM